MPSSGLRSCCVPLTTPVCSSGRSSLIEAWPLVDAPLGAESASVLESLTKPPGATPAEIACGPSVALAVSRSRSRQRAAELSRQRCQECRGALVGVLRMTGRELAAVAGHATGELSCARSASASQRHYPRPNLYPHTCGGKSFSSLR